MSIADFSCLFSLNEGENAWNEEKLKLRVFFLTCASHGSIFFPERLIPALCTHHPLLLAFMTNAAAISASYWSVSLKIGCAQNFCASLSRDSRLSLAGRCSRRAGITSCLNLSANQQSNVVLFFLLVFLTHRSRSPKADLSRWESPHRALQCLTYVLDLSAEAV